MAAVNAGQAFVLVLEFKEVCHCDDSESSEKAVGMITGCNRNSRLGYAIPYQPILTISDLFS